MSEILRDRNGYPIHSGDVLKVYHFTDRRRRRWFMYKLAVAEGGRLFGVTVGDIVKSGFAHAHRYTLSGGADAGGYLMDHEIVEGYGPRPDCIDFTDRVRVRPSPAPVGEAV